MKQLNIGLIGYGFMGRAHSNAFRKVSNFFDLAYQPILRAVCARDESKVRALAAAKAGKMILCEKPLSMNGPEGLKMVQAVEKAGVPNMVWYNYRRVPAVTLAKQLIDEGR